MLWQTVNLNDDIRNLFYFTGEICAFSHIRAKFSPSRNYAKVQILHSLTNTDLVRDLVREGYLFSNNAIKSRRTENSDSLISR